MLTLSCTQEKHYGHKGEFPCNLFVDSSFTDEELSMIIESVEAWEQATDNIASIKLTANFSIDGATCSILPFHCIIRSLEADLETQEAIKKINAPSLVGWADNVSVHIIVDRIDTSDKFINVVSHELGHHFGLGHSTSTSDIMYQSPQLTRTPISEVDVKAFCCVNDCGTKRINTCNDNLNGELDDPPYWSDWTDSFEF